MFSFLILQFVASSHQFKKILTQVQNHTNLFLKLQIKIF
jgi:hypothetical protein